ncbi:hypothetical protein DPEC_G00070990 [Dallia pectoralis]|uniref:Uncharacterized protein n=2 Tax=Dallia pectoralis TaxID=75939 RepID=A0ACC2H2B0_DALPE|nr:hypothetical protein DPEC_G00363910 [Dallia pectoralis]KAJ8009831.1 hypothetical protein DPEC_G00068280 [Dallia pectoralis]KAJ8010054.1 hypothetical protein DPEC_G00070990 [Dallia pectoralis]
MASATLAATKPKPCVKDTGASPKHAPLIHERNKYAYMPALMNVLVQDIERSARVKNVKLSVPTTSYATSKLVHSLCSAAAANVWGPECEKALVEGLPLREHHKAFLSHNMFVTMIGAVVARALEQATSGSEDTLDLLANRYYVRRIACHDSSKTSAIEAAAYAGIMAVHIEKDALAVNEKKLVQLNKRHGSHQAEEEVKSWSLDKLYTDTDAITTAMANFGFKHHYEKNSHHPEHFPKGEMDDMSLVEAIVDGLACIFERNKSHRDVHSWLSMYYVVRFEGRTKDLAQNIIEALKLYITDADYEALEAFRSSVFSIIGESIPWTRVMMTECCSHKTTKDGGLPGRDLTSCFSRNK